MSTRRKILQNPMVTRSVKCGCASLDYYKTYAYLTADAVSLTPVWKCTNCNTETSRTTRNRKANWQIAMDRWNEIIEAAKPFSGSGNWASQCSIDYHTRQLSNSLETKKISRFSIRYHCREAMKIVNQLKEGSES